MKGLMQEFLAVFAIVYVLVFAGACVVIILTGDAGCESKMRRIDYIIPATTVGCWLKEEID